MVFGIPSRIFVVVVAAVLCGVGLYMMMVVYPPAYTQRVGEQPIISVSPNLVQVKPAALLDPLSVGIQAPNLKVQSVHSAVRGGAKTAAFEAFFKTLSPKDETENKVGLVFFRCDEPEDCRKQLVDFDTHIKTFKDANTQLVAVGAVTLKQAKQIQRKLKLNFPVIPDPKRSIIEQYGVADVQSGEAWPAAFIIGPERTIQWSYVGVEPVPLMTDDLKPGLSSMAVSMD
ncbi:MAG: peroxiredoxin family protein [Vampirovibrio sp.]|nr:peroxiredoxin family protein [Vampirovibrio sp.]